MSRRRRTWEARWRALVGLAARSWRGYLLIGVLTIVSSGVTLLQPWPMQVLVDHVIAGRPAPAWLTAVFHTIPGGEAPVGVTLWLAGAGVLIFALDAATDVAVTLAWLRVVQGSVYDLGRRLFGRLVRRSPAFHAATPVGDSVSRVTGDAWCLYNGASALLFAPLHALVMVAAMGTILVRLDPWLAAAALVAVPFLAASVAVLGRRAEEAKTLEREIESRLESHVQQALAGIRVVQSFAQEDREQRRFTDLAGQAGRMQRRSAGIGALASGAGGLATAAGTGFVLAIGALEVLRGRLTLGELLVFLGYLASLNAQLVAVAAAYTSARGLGASIDRVMDVLEATPEVRERPGARNLLPPNRHGAELRFERVTFGYTPSRPVLDSIDLTIPAGATVALVGPSGAGKSTLAALAARLDDPWSGRVLLDGVDLRDGTLESVRAAVALAPQDAVLFAESVHDNISLGKCDATRSQVEAAAAVAGADTVVEGLLEGYGTVVGAEGATLSVGQRQRIAIARAILRDAPVLILDEPTAALDAAAERRLIDGLRRNRGGRTTVIIAHRLSTARAADLIAVMDAGRVTEFGTPAELAGRDGRYARLLRAQAARPMLAQTEGAA